MPPGSGHLFVGGFAVPNKLGAMGRYVHRLSLAWAAYAEGWAGMSRDDRSSPWQRDFGAVAGVEHQWGA